jgi:hypothetical protein
LLRIYGGGEKPVSGNEKVAAVKTKKLSKTEQKNIFEKKDLKKSSFCL